MRFRSLRRTFRRFRKRRLGRVITRILQVIAGLYIAYVTVINLMFVTGLAERLANRNPDKFQFTFSSAWSFWPGSVHAKHFVFRGQDSVLQWRIELDDATAHFALTELFAKRVHMTTGWASGASARFRMKLDPADASSPAAKMLPPIPGFADPPIKGAPVPDPPDDAYPYFTFDFEDGTGENVREVWFDTLHFTDAGDAHGGFYLKPNRRVEVHPTTANFKDATIQEGATIIVEHVHGNATVHIEGFDPRKPSGREVLAFVDAKTALVGQLSSLRFLNLHTTGKSIGFDGGGGPFYLGIDAVRGTFRPGSRVKAVLNDWQVYSSPHRVAGTTALEAHVDETREGLGWLESYGISLRRNRLDVLAVPMVGIFARTKSLDMSKPIADWMASVDAPAGTAPNLAAVNLYIDKPLFVGGTATFAAHVDSNQDQAHGHGNASTQNATIVLADRQIATAGSAAVVLKSLNLHTDHGDLAGTSFEVHDVVYGKDKAEAAWWARATVGPGEFALDSGTLDLTLSGKARDAKPFWSLLALNQTVANLIGGDALTVAGNVHFGPSLFEVGHLHAVGNDFDLQARYRAQTPNKRGVAFLRRGPVTVGVELDGDSVTVHPLASEPWFRGAAWRLK